MTRSAAILAAASLIPLAALAENREDPLLLGDIVVSATRTPLEKARSGSSVSVVTETEIERWRQPVINDYLERVPGISISQRGAPGSSSEFSLRGVGREGVVVRVDGIELSDPGELQVQADLNQLLMGDISRIEVLKGSQSALYGGEAVGGVIDITSRRARGTGFGHSVLAEGGSYTSLRGGYTLTGGFERGDFALSAQHFRTDGFSAAAGGEEDDGYDNTTLSGVGSYDVTGDLTLGGAFRVFDRETEIDRVSRGVPIDATGRTAETRLGAGRAFAEYRAFDDRFVSEVSVQHLRSRRDFTEATESFFKGSRTKVEYLGSVEAAERVDLVFGGDWTREGVETSDDLDETTRIAGGFLQAIVEPMDDLTLTGSGRVDDHSEFGTFATWRGTAAYQFPTGTTLRGAVGTGFRAPSNRELFSPDDPFLGPVGNPDLEPEESLSWEVGADQRLWDGRARLSATYFEIRTDELIQFVFGEGYEQVPGETVRRGVEVEAGMSPLDWVDLGVGYTFIETETDAGERLDNVPRHDVSLTAAVRPAERVRLAVSGSYVTDVMDNGVELDPFFLLDAVAAYEVSEGVELYVRGENLLDQDYQRVRGFATSGIAGYVGLRATF